MSYQQRVGWKPTDANGKPTRDPHTTKGLMDLWRAAGEQAKQGEPKKFGTSSDSLTKWRASTAPEEAKPVTTIDKLRLLAKLHKKAGDTASASEAEAHATRLENEAGDVV